MAVNLIHLRYFLAIAECGGLSAAAKKLKVKQPTLTVALKNLEQSLGTTLVIRERNGVRLTATGRQLIARFRALESAVEKIARRELAPWIRRGTSSRGLPAASGRRPLPPRHAKRARPSKRRP